MNYRLGIDIGTVNVKTTLLDADNRIIRVDSERIVQDSRSAVNNLIIRTGEQVSLDKIGGVGVNGTGRDLIPDGWNWVEHGNSISIAAGILHRCPDAGTIIQIGGQSSLVIEIEDGLRKPWKVYSNSLCAAGTGRFIEQQAYRLGISLDEFSEIALRTQGDSPRIAARCSVFAKSDIIHLQQKGVSVEMMLFALCESIARMVISLKKGKFKEPVYFAGGVAANRAVQKALQENISLRNGHDSVVKIPDDYLHIQSLGAALLTDTRNSHLDLIPANGAQQPYYEMPALPKTDCAEGKQFDHIEKSGKGYLGIDVGSTSTKAVIVDEAGQTILAKSYLMTAGRPVDAVKAVFSNLLRDGADKIIIAGAGVTGSGRYLVGSLVGADVVKNEITAQTRAAAVIDNEADIIEIGGQDSKLVLKKDGVVVDYQMNKACAAGTGSFIDELAEMLDVSVTDGQFSRLAFEAPYTIDLGTRCAAFMGQAVSSAQIEGVPLPVITASLANSIAKNYLSKVVGSRKLGRKIILTGAVFHNQAVAAAFRQQLPDKILVVAEHREVSGALGAALIARDRSDGAASKFKGFQTVINGKVALSTFNCQYCDNSCTVTRMETNGGASQFYGSRCDRYDSMLNQKRKDTYFDEREALLLRDMKNTSGKPIKVGIPRALFVYDYAPLLIGFLNELGVEVVLSGKTTRANIEKSIELAYTDSCFPLKLLHGHASELQDCTYILYPSAIRLGEKEEEKNQKYTCPLVQASPFIIRSVLGLEKSLLIPLLDFSQGDEDVKKSLITIALKMGFKRKIARRAADAGIDSLRRFEEDLAGKGKELFQQLQSQGRLGVVIFSRSYMSQDAGANLGIAEKLKSLGVEPIPIDFLPLKTVDPKQYSDRPYWAYEAKFIAGAHLVASSPNLYGLVLTNFGCGPNSFIIPILHDIMNGKPMGQLEIDEHAAEAGLVTRLEAFVDTINSFHAGGKIKTETNKQIYRGVTATLNTRKALLIPRMAPQAEALAAAMEASGVQAIVLPEPDSRNLLYSNQLTSGTECLPYRVTLGDFLRFYHENGHELQHHQVEGFMSGSYGPCRLGKYAIEQSRVLKDVGFDLNIRTTVSNNAYHDLGLGPGFERLGWRAILSVDNLQKVLFRTRPYEKRAGSADELFDYYLKKITDAVRKKQVYTEVLVQATHEFRSLIDSTVPRKPRVGINGEIFLRLNRFSNNDLARVCEAAGLEVAISPIAEWLNYTLSRNFEDAVKSRNMKSILISYLKKFIREHDERKVTTYFHHILDEVDPKTEAILSKSSFFISPRCGSEAVLSIGAGLEWMESPDFAGVISVMPHGCMPGGIVAAMAEKFTELYEKPWISLTYDGFMETHNTTRIIEFAELVKFCRQVAVR